MRGGALLRFGRDNPDLAQVLEGLQAVGHVAVVVRNEDARGRLGIVHPAGRRSFYARRPGNVCSLGHVNELNVVPRGKWVLDEEALCSTKNAAARAATVIVSRPGGCAVVAVRPNTGAGPVSDRRFAG